MSGRLQALIVVLLVAFFGVPTKAYAAMCSDAVAECAKCCCCHKAARSRDDDASHQTAPGEQRPGLQRPACCKIETSDLESDHEFTIDAPQRDVVPAAVYETISLTRAPTLQRPSAGHSARGPPPAKAPRYIRNRSLII